MQHVSAFSRPQTVPAAPALAAGRKPSLWILDGWRDLILYVCTPLLLVPIFIGAQGLWAAEDIYLFVAADDRHPGNILFRGRPIHSPDTSASRAAGIACAGASGFSSIFGEFYLDVEQRETAEPGETRASRHEHFVLVVLQ